MAEGTRVAQEVGKEESKLLLEFEKVFEKPIGLPPTRNHEHQTILKEGAQPTCVRPYRKHFTLPPPIPHSSPPLHNNHHHLLPNPVPTPPPPQPKPPKHPPQLRHLVCPRSRDNLTRPNRLHMQVQFSIKPRDLNVASVVARHSMFSNTRLPCIALKVDQIKSAALDQIQIQQIKSLSLSDIIPSQLSLPSSNSDSVSYSPSELRIFGVTDDLRDLVKGLTSSGSSGSQS
uniref:Uncharacterized protein n=1 Tax=Fagus sylvatica TaxID=28930 RepID=A0A2N9F044_FAGSY